MGFAEDLAALRAGELTFDLFGSRHRERFRRWAAHYFNRWPQTALDVEDLAQEAFLEAWRAVDAYQEGKGPTLQRFVEYRVGRRLRVELERVLGWPKKSRGTKAVRPLSLDADETLQRAIERSDATGPDGYHRLLIREAAASAEGELEQVVTAGIGLGLSARSVAAHLWEDPLTRYRHRFDSQADAQRRVAKAARNATGHLANHTGMTPVG